MKYRLQWKEWKSLPEEKQMAFWKSITDDPINLESANFVPTIIEMLIYLKRPGSETLCDELWKQIVKTL